MKITKKYLKQIIRESIDEQQNTDPLAGKTRAPAGGTVNANDPLAGKTKAPAQNVQQGGTINKNVVLNIKKQLQVLMGEIDKVLGGA